ncbi:MAG: UdgX family uracil-DNA binding protein [Chloroflexi bacterium]|nr:MAG: UdgX family uracil-DNA binding protein [Chloroflexota bacterium]
MCRWLALLSSQGRLAAPSLRRRDRPGVTPPDDAGADQLGAGEYVPEDRRLEALRDAAAGCRGCDLWQRATRTVFGEGNPQALIMLVGEQPGDREDLAGHPFVGPAGRLLDEALERAGIDRKLVYVTNAVKHFSWTPSRGKRRIHKRPTERQIVACRPWLVAEIDAVQPRVVVALGATAARALIGPDVRVSVDRGRTFRGLNGSTVVPTVHPSSILRLIDQPEYEGLMSVFVRDLKAATQARSGRPTSRSR